MPPCCDPFWCARDNPLGLFRRPFRLRPWRLHRDGRQHLLVALRARTTGGRGQRHLNCNDAHATKGMKPKHLKILTLALTPSCSMPLSVGRQPNRSLRRLVVRKMRVVPGPGRASRRERQATPGQTCARLSARTAETVCRSTAAAARPATPRHGCCCRGGNICRHEYEGCRLDRSDCRCRRMKSRCRDRSRQWLTDLTRQHRPPSTPRPVQEFAPPKPERRSEEISATAGALDNLFPRAPSPNHQRIGESRRMRCNYADSNRE